MALRMPNHSDSAPALPSAAGAAGAGAERRAGGTIHGL